MEALQKTDSDENTARRGVAKELTTLKGFGFVVRSAGCKCDGVQKTLEPARAEVALLKDQVARADTENADSDMLLAVVREEVKQCVVRLTVAILDCNRAGQLTRALVTESARAVDALVQQLSCDAVSWLRQGLETAYSTVHVRCPVVLTRVFTVAATSARWKSEGSGDEKESEPAEGRPTETRKGFEKASRPQVWQWLWSVSLVLFCFSCN